MTRRPVAAWSEETTATRPRRVATVFFKDRWINPFFAAGSTGTVIDDFNNDNFDHSGLGFHGGGYIGANVFNGRPITTRSVPPGTPRWGTQWKQANADWYAHAFSVSVHGSCYPHQQNYLDLDPVYRDAYGQPLVRMTFDFRDNELRMSEYCTSKANEIAKALGATIVGPADLAKDPSTRASIRRPTTPAAHRWAPIRSRVRYRPICSTGTRRISSSSARPSTRRTRATTRPVLSPRWRCGSATT